MVRALDDNPAAVLVILAIGAAASITAFMTIGANGQWGFVLPFRGTKVVAMVLVGFAIAVSTVLFQTITQNRILTPSIMGFDALYLLVQTSVVFFIGSSALVDVDPRFRFAAEVAIMLVFALLLYRFLFSGGLRGLHLLVLVGVVFGVLFRSLGNLMQRLIDPNEFAILQDRFFASFNRVDNDLLAISAILVLGVTAIGWRWRHRFDVLALGREVSISLGVDHQRAVTGVLILVTILVSVSTALVGPVTFFGLLVANLAYLMIPSHRHMLILPAAALLAVIALIGGQLVLERVFGLDTALSIIIEFIGGILFIVLLLRGAR
ncbi:MAG: iron chelate uptake ABC transporter family permease subunit [Pseudomonadota bacterium]